MARHKGVEAFCHICGQFLDNPQKDQKYCQPTGDERRSPCQMAATRLIRKRRTKKKAPQRDYSIREFGEPCWTFLLDEIDIAREKGVNIDIKAVAKEMRTTEQKVLKNIPIAVRHGRAGLLDMYMEKRRKMGVYDSCEGIHYRD